MLVNSNEMLLKAKQSGYAIAHFNINNLEWTRYILEASEGLKTPVILGVSEGAIKYIGGYLTVYHIVSSLMKDLNISIDVCLHLDHGSSVESCKKAIDNGFTSVMIDASQYPFLENVKITKEVVEYAHTRGVSVEAELGHFGGSEDGMEYNTFHARVEEVIPFYEMTKVDSLAPALGSVHGLYQKEPNLDFDTMKKIKELLPIPLVLHGGTGIPKEQIEKAIDCGINKININTELQITWAKEVRKYLDENQEVYDPRKIIGSGKDAIIKKVQALILEFMKKNSTKEDIDNKI